MARIDPGSWRNANSLMREIYEELDVLEMFTAVGLFFNMNRANTLPIVIATCGLHQ